MNYLLSWFADQTYISGHSKLRDWYKKWILLSKANVPLLNSIKA